VSRLRFAAMLGKSMGYISYGLTQTFKLSSTVISKLGNAIKNNPTYNLEIIDKNGELIKTYENVNLVKLNKVISSIHHLHDNYKINIEEYNVSSTIAE
tara:strand:+ start:755 stop:1048 length:294 start_codon:yes stop_codon:yes gene_type:complete